MTGLESTKFYQLLRLNDLQDNLTRLHLRVLKPSIKAAIPIPGIFRKIDFRQIGIELDEISSEVQCIQRDYVGLEETPLPGLHWPTVDALFEVYTSNITSAVDALIDVTSALARKADGQRLDLQEYNALVEQYMLAADNLLRTGAQLTAAVRA